MASSSSSSSSSADFPSSFYCSCSSMSAQVKPRTYGVFLNFRGKDTREGFVSFLHRDMERRGIRAYLDSVELEKGAHIDTIIDAIQDSNIAVVVFSKEYATSSFCLAELVEIMECRKTTGLLVLVVFYRVTPENVENVEDEKDLENPNKSFAKEFVTHKESNDEATISKWKTALKKAAPIAGWDYASKDISDESALVTKIVEDVLGKLRRVYSTNDFNGLVGMHSRVKKLESLLRIGEEENDTHTRTVGICGMGGIGKTTLARAVFDKYASHFQASCFVGSVRQQSEHVRLHQLRDELFGSLLNNRANRSVYVSPSTSSSGFVTNQLCYTKVLIVLDDVDMYEQIQALAEKNVEFGAGSRIIITSRDRQVLKNRVDSIHDIQILDYYEGRQLFNLHAFKDIYPLEDRWEHSQGFVGYVKGHPYALEVLGLFLYDKSEAVWDSALKELKTTSFNLLQAVHQSIRISYKGLAPADKEMFLHIACFFRGEPKTLVEKLLDACDFSTAVCLSRLADKSLINFISDSTIEMHDLSQDVGREIVQQQGEPGRRSRLWRSKEICDVLANNKGTPAVEGIFLDVSMIDSVCLGQTLFSNMTEIKLLKFYHPKIATFVADYRGRFTRRYDPYICYVTYQHNLSCPRGLDSLPHQLRYLVWHLYPLKYLPPKFCFEKLVELDMSYSNVKRLWTGNQDLPNLRVVKMGHCKHLIEMPNFSRAPKVEIIDFQYCEQLPRISPSIACLKNLMELNLSCCSKIENVPSTKNLPSLEKLLLSNCKRLDKLSEFSEKIEELNLDGTAITEIHSSSQLRSLRKIDLSDCCNLRNFPELSQSLEELYLSQTPAAILECPSIRDFLGGGFSSLRHLDVSKCLVAEIPLSIKQLWHLESLEVSRSPSLAILPELPPHVILLKARFCESLVIVPNSSFALTESYQKSLNFTVVFEFDGCYKLSQEAQTNISNHALCIIQTLSRLPQNVDRKYEIKFIYAGNKIPDWINCGNPGSSITVDLPPDWHDTSKFFGFVLCVVFSDTTVSPEPLVCECHFKSKNGTRDAKFHVTLMHSWCKLKQNVFLWYSSHLNLHQAIIGNVKEEEDYSEASFHFHLLWRTSDKRLESCGVRLLYNH